MTTVSEAAEALDAWIDNNPSKSIEEWVDYAGTLLSEPALKWDLIKHSKYYSRICTHASSRLNYWKIMNPNKSDEQIDEYARAVRDRYCAYDIIY